MPILLQTDDIRILVYPGDHPPIHVHVVTKNRSLEVKIDISCSEPMEMRPAKDERMKTTAKHTKRALKLCSDNLEILREGAEKYYAAQ
ncbi:MAG: hypothetical protein DCF15_04480 [Phormidesmis priestleyi]|uniref:DUF4160 domain-containing protein n=1 Tax=Phormidesmis priestleyi TaxID=268141 RepID=A0A2W4XMV7_9CYAN|nr:MAG: hypothetical protein DCF15_04480 [Phormidesmis priestleyi]